MLHSIEKIIKKFSDFYFSKYREKFIENWGADVTKWPKNDPNSKNKDRKNLKFDFLSIQSNLNTFEKKIKKLENNNFRSNIEAFFFGKKMQIIFLFWWTYPQLRQSQNPNFEYKQNRPKENSKNLKKNNFLGFRTLLIFLN